jgi:hypothetical protein
MFLTKKVTAIRLQIFLSSRKKVIFFQIYYMEKKYWITVQHRRPYMFVHSSPINTHTHILPLWAPPQTVNPCLHVRIQYESSSTQSSGVCAIHVSTSDTKFSELTCLHPRLNTKIQHKIDDPCATHGNVSSSTKKSEVAVTDIQRRVPLCPHFELMLSKFTSQELST